MTASAKQPPGTAEQLRVRLARLPEEPLAPDQADAAVLILLRVAGAGPEVLAEQRAERAGDPWSGHVGLPGGRKSPIDSSLAETVLRELREEVGIPRSAVDGGPRMFDVRKARPSGLRVAVFAGQLAGSPDPPQGIDPEEVATTFWFPLRALEGLERQPPPGLFGAIQVDAVHFGDHVVWGFTLRLLRDFDSWLNTSGDGAGRPRCESRPWRSQAL
ncbi:MAG TPA: CoA pyrophosphatase [Thermoplasmata archaeon]|nr:CoA pyrophosphatase [Thermoplasmata archaeon]